MAAFVKLAEEFGNPVSDAVAKDRPVKPSDFDDDMTSVSFGLLLNRQRDSVHRAAGRAPIGYEP